MYTHSYACITTQTQTQQNKHNHTEDKKQQTCIRIYIHIGRQHCASPAFEMNEFWKAMSPISVASIVATGQYFLLCLIILEMGGWCRCNTCKLLNHIDSLAL